MTNTTFTTFQEIEATLVDSPIEGGLAQLTSDQRVAALGRAVLLNRMADQVPVRFAWENVAHDAKKAGCPHLAGLMLGKDRELLLLAAMAAR